MIQGGQGAPEVIPAVHVTHGAKVTSRGESITGNGAPAVLVDGASQFNSDPLPDDSESLTHLSRSTPTITDGTSNTLIVSESSTADLNQVDVSGTTDIRDGSSSTIGFSETPGGSATVDNVRVGWRSYVQMDNVTCGGSVHFAAQDALGDGSVRTISTTDDGAARFIAEDSQVRDTAEASQNGCLPDVVDGVSQ